MKKHLFRLSVIVLVRVLAVVSFYMLYVHVPYYNYHHGLDEIDVYKRQDDCYLFGHFSSSLYMGRTFKLY